MPGSTLEDGDGHGDKDGSNKIVIKVEANALSPDENGSRTDTSGNKNEQSPRVQDWASECTTPESKQTNQSERDRREERFQTLEDELAEEMEELQERGLRDRQEEILDRIRGILSDRKSKLPIDEIYET